MNDLDLALLSFEEAWDLLYNTAGAWVDWLGPLCRLRPDIARQIAARWVASKDRMSTRSTQVFLDAGFTLDKENHCTGWRPL